MGWPPFTATAGVPSEFSRHRQFIRGVAISAAQMRDPHLSEDLAAGAASDEETVLTVHSSLPVEIHSGTGGACEVFASGHTS